MPKPVAFLVCALLLLPAPAFSQGKTKSHLDVTQIGRRDINKGKWNFYSKERELELGRQLAQEAERTSHLLTNPFVVRYVTSVAERVARHSDLQVPVHVRVIDTGEISAFALPGGHFFITGRPR